MQLDPATENALSRVRRQDARSVLAEWAERHEIRLRSANWTGAGYTDAQLLGLYVQEAGTPTRSLIVKIKPPGTSPDREPRANHAARRAFGDFGRRHLAGPAYDPLPFATGGSITFQAVAGSGFGDLIGFDAMLVEHDRADATCQQIVTSLLTEWNTELQPVATEHVGRLLREILGDRLNPGGTLDSLARERRRASDLSIRLPHGDQTLVNPFALAIDSDVSDGPHILTLRGMVHGDLHPGNLLVAASPGTPLDFCLVDLARFSATGLLAWDPVYLTITAAAKHVESLSSNERDWLRQLLLDPELAPSRIRPATLRRVILGVTQAERAYATSQGLLYEWRRLRLLCITAVGLILSGRCLLPELAQDWCFWLSAHAATALINMTSTERLAENDRLKQPRSDIVAASPGKRGTRTASPPQEKSSHPGPRLLDRENAREALHKRLTEGPPGIVIVRGDEGVGKSLLVESVLQNLDPQRVHVHRHEAFPGIPFDVRTLTDDLVHPAQLSHHAASPIAQDEEFFRSSVARLEGALQGLEDTPVVIVIESAENLIRPGSPVLADLDLDEAFEMLAEAERHRVTVVLVTRREPQSPQGSTWPTAQPQIEVPALPAPEFDQFLDALDGAHRLDLSALKAASRAAFAAAVRRNPRTTEFACTILASAVSGLQPETLITGLQGQRKSEVPRWVADRLIVSCDVAERSVLDALAACRIPVTQPSLAAVLDGHLTEPQLAAGLRRLTRRSIVRVAEGEGGRYFLPASHLRDALDEALETGTGERRSSPSPLLASAAYELRRHRADPPRSLGELDITFAELKALLRARRYVAAYRVIEWIDDALREWHCSAILLKHREQVAGELDDDHLEMANDNQLAHLYTLAGNYPEAETVYRRAFVYAERREDGPARAVLAVNAAGLDRQRGAGADARRGYEAVLKSISHSGPAKVMVQALEGLADCDRRQGRYPQALANAMEAITFQDTASHLDDPEARAFVSSRQVRCRLKLASWYVELGNPDTAEHHLQAAERQAHDRDDQWLIGACLDGRADLLLAQTKLSEAVAVATAAEDHALRVNDAVTLMRARTTLCTAYLMRNDGPASPHTIERTLRYRRTGHSLIVMALCALLAAQRQDDVRADALFRLLRDDARGRIKRDPLDFAARDLLALAVCALEPHDEVAMRTATREFAQARALTTVPVPGLVHRLVWMLERLSDIRGTRSQLDPALMMLRGTRLGSS